MDVPVPEVKVRLAKDNESATVSIEFPWLKQADAFAKICRAVLQNMQPVLEGEDKSLHYD